MRVFATFLRLYPSYNLDQALNMPAVSFFALLNEGYRLQSYDYLTLATISDLPKMTKQNRKKFYDRLEFAATHPGDILKPSGDGDDPARIKKLLGG